MQPLELGLQHAGAARPHIIHQQLQIAAVAVNPDLAVRQHLIALPEFRAAVAPAKEHAGQRAVVVREAKVDVPRARAAVVAHLALDPDILQQIIGLQ